MGNLLRFLFSARHVPLLRGLLRRFQFDGGFLLLRQQQQQQQQRSLHIRGGRRQALRALHPAAQVEIRVSNLGPYQVQAYLGTVVGGRRGVENGPAGGGIRIFPAGGGSTFCSRGGEGYCKIAKRALKMHFLREFWNFIQNMCNFAFLRHIFYYFYLQYGENSLVTKGGQQKKFLTPRGGQ